MFLQIEVGTMKEDKYLMAISFLWILQVKQITNIVKILGFSKYICALSNLLENVGFDKAMRRNWKRREIRWKPM